MAGESAKNKAERLRRSADRYDRGAEGEEATAAALAQLPPGWMAFHDVAWPGRELANIDHVVVGAPGVFVIDSKNWSGRITLTRGELRQNGHHRPSASQGALAAASAVAALVPDVPPEHITPVLCFKDGPDGLDGGVLVSSVAGLVPMLISRPPTMAGEAVLRVAGDLRAQLPSATAARTSSAPVPRPARPTKPKRIDGTRLVRPLIGFAVAVAFLANPDVVTALTSGVSDVFTEPMTPAVNQPVAPDRGEGGRKTPAQQQNNPRPARN